MFDHSIMCDQLNLQHLLKCCTYCRLLQQSQDCKSMHSDILSDDDMRGLTEVELFHWNLYQNFAKNFDC